MYPLSVSVYSVSDLHFSNAGMKGMLSISGRVHPLEVALAEFMTGRNIMIHRYIHNKDTKIHT